MENFIIKKANKNIEEELNEIGYDKTHIIHVKNKFNYTNFKIFNVSVAQANILKQTALSVGADCATHHDVITGKIETSNCILGGSFSQIKKISEKLKYQPFGLKNLGEQLLKILSEDLTIIKIKNKTFDFTRPYIVGILNLGNSFSDGYENINDAKKHFDELLNDGADIIDIGAESTRPNSLPVEDNIQINKILPILEYAKDKNIPLSIDTRSSKVARMCLENGADIINDVSGFDYDNNMINVICEYNCPVILQHSSATPDIMQNHTQYNNLVEDIFINLRNKLILAKQNGINNVILDVGIGFGKTREQNLELLQRFEEFYSLNVPLMLGISRKSFLNMQDENNLTKDIYTLAIDSILMSKKINFVRVHNVKFHKKLLDTKILEQ